MKKQNIPWKLEGTPQFEGFIEVLFEGFWQIIISANKVSFLGGGGEALGGMPLNIYEHLFDTSIMTILEDNVKTSQAH